MKRLIQVAKDSPIMLFFALSVVTFTCIMMGNDVHLDMPQWVAFVVKVGLLTLVGWATADMVSIIPRLNVPDQLLHQLKHIIMAVFLLSFFIAMIIFSLLQLPYLTWRTPTLFITYLYLLHSVDQLKRRL